MLTQQKGTFYQPPYILKNNIQEIVMRKISIVDLACVFMIALC